MLGEGDNFQVISLKIESSLFDVIENNLMCFH